MFFKILEVFLLVVLDSSHFIRKKHTCAQLCVRLNNVSKFLNGNTDNVFAKKGIPEKTAYSTSIAIRAKKKPMRVKDELDMCHVKQKVQRYHQQIIINLNFKRG